MWAARKGFPYLAKDTKGPKRPALSAAEAPGLGGFFLRSASCGAANPGRSRLFQAAGPARERVRGLNSPPHGVHIIVGLRHALH